MQHHHPPAEQGVEATPLPLPGQTCIELHCAAVYFEHNYGEPECSWVLLPDGSVVHRTELL